MWLATCHTDLVTQPKNPDRHKHPGVLARPDPKTREAIQKALTARGWTLNEFLIACMALGAANPDAMLRRLAQFRPPIRRGRPPTAQ